jgi:hypothetical protein
MPGAETAVAIPVKRLDELAILGPDRRDIYDGFRISNVETAYPAFWGHDAEKITSVAANPNKCLSPLVNAQPRRHLRSPGLLWSRAGRIMIGERLWLVTQRVIAVRLHELALANVWWPARLKSEDERHEKALALWFNSTLGILLSVAHRVPTRGPWVSFKKPVLERMPVLDVEALDTETLTTLGAKYDEVSTKGLDPIPNLNHDATRREIDEAFMSALAIPDVRPVADLLAREPVVSNRRIQPSIK